VDILFGGDTAAWTAAVIGGQQRAAELGEAYSFVECLAAAEAQQQDQPQQQAMQQQAQQQRQTEACNRAFNDFDAARKTTDDATAVAYYQSGLAIRPSDDVAHY